MAEAAQSPPQAMQGTTAEPLSKGYSSTALTRQTLAPPTDTQQSMEVTVRGPRIDETGKIVARSILGDPDTYEAMMKTQTHDGGQRTSQQGSPRAPGRARFASNASLQSSPKDMTLAIGGVTTRAISPTGHDDLMESQRDALDKEATLRQQLTVLADSKRKERDDRMKKIKGLHIFQRNDELRERRILGRHEKRQAEWEAFRERMAKRLQKDPDDLVINRAEEWRMLLEEKSLLAKATPIEKRQGANVWQMSLRDAWTRYIAVGGEFSGLEMPFIDRPELQPDSMYYVRQPFKQTHVDLSKTRGSGQPNRLDELRNEYSKAISVLEPSKVEFEGLHILGDGLETKYRNDLAETVRIKREEQEAMAKEEAEKARRASRMPTYRSKNTSDGEQTARSATAMSLSRAPSTRMLETASTVGKGIQFTQWEPEVEAPCMNFESDRLIIDTMKSEIGEAVLNCMNTGNCAVYYKWVRQTKQAIPGANNEQQRFFLKDMVGSILPGETKEFTFTFSSEKPGVFSEIWTMEGRPDVQETRWELTIKGIAKEEDITKASRSNLEKKLADSQMRHAIQETIDEVVAHVGTPRVKPRTLVEDPDVDRQVFIAQNKEAQIYYSNTTLKLFRSLADSTFELLSFPDELRKWDSSLASLKRLIYAIEDDGERERHIIQFNEIMKVAGIPPSSTSMFNSIAYELVAELADSIPDKADNIRKKLDLKDNTLVFKEEAERDLVFCTGTEGQEMWRYDTHLMRIGGPPIEYMDQEANEGTVKVSKKINVEVWGPEQEEEEEEAAEEDEGPKDERDEETLGRLEFEYRLRLNDEVYFNFAEMTERFALLSAEADLRSQVIAQVVKELNEAAAEEIRTLIREDKMDEARKIDPNKYQKIVDLDAIFRDVIKEEQEMEKRRQDSHVNLESTPAEGQEPASGPAILSVP